MINKINLFLLVEKMRAGQLSSSLHFLPAYGTVVRVLCQIIACGQRIALFHVVKNPQIVSMLFKFALNLIRQISQLHYDHQACHRQENIAPKQHVKVMK